MTIEDKEYLPILKSGIATWDTIKSYRVDKKKTKLSKEL